MSLFTPKTHGYGAAPADWRGWAAILAFGLVQALVVGLGLLWPLAGGQEPSIARFVVWMGISVGLTIAFLWWVRRNTDGQWRWRWGGKD